MQFGHEHEMRVRYEVSVRREGWLYKYTAPEQGSEMR